MNDEEIRLLKLAIRSYPSTTFFDLLSDGHGNPIRFMPVVVGSETPDGDRLFGFNGKVYKRDSLFTEGDLVFKETDPDIPF